MASPDNNMWKKAMDEEIKSLNENNTWILVDVPESERKSVHVIGCKWIYKKKLTSTGEVERYKARLVAKGYSQQHGVDYHDTFAPVMKYKSMRIMLFIANRLGYELEQLDVVTAFLNGKLKEVVYMYQPQGYGKGDTRNKICKLVKSLYGTKQAPREWNNELNDFLTKIIKMKRCISDPCLYTVKNAGRRLFWQTCQIETLDILALFEAILRGFLLRLYSR
jgi:vacuolar-type H+-ATPase catalytic subunit A/Vma1